MRNFISLCGNLWRKTENKEFKTRIGVAVCLDSSEKVSFQQHKSPLEAVIGCKGLRKYLSFTKVVTILTRQRAHWHGNESTERGSTDAHTQLLSTHTRPWFGHRANIKCVNFSLRKRISCFYLVNFKYCELLGPQSLHYWYILSAVRSPQPSSTTLVDVSTFDPLLVVLQLPLLSHTCCVDWQFAPGALQSMLGKLGNCWPLLFHCAETATNKHKNATNNNLFILIRHWHGWKSLKKLFSLSVRFYLRSFEAASRGQVSVARSFHFFCVCFRRFSRAFRPTRAVFLLSWASMFVLWRRKLNHFGSKRFSSDNSSRLVYVVYSWAGHFRPRRLSTGWLAHRPSDSIKIDFSHMIRPQSRQACLTFETWRAGKQKKFLDN